MKATGIVRKTDNLGRVVIPMELRRSLEIEENEPMEIFVDGESIILKKYQPDESATRKVNELRKKFSEEEILKALTKLEQKK